MITSSKSIATFVIALLISTSSFTQDSKAKTTPIFKDGEAQIVEAFNGGLNDWIHHDLWVETEFDTDGDGEPDRMHVSVTRPKQTDTEGLKLPVIYITSPYFAGVAGDAPGIMWDVNIELGEIAKARVHPNVISRPMTRPFISYSHINKWVPRGYIVVHSSSPGTGLSDGAPTIGGENESLAPKTVIDWLCGRAKGYTERNGNEEVNAYWSTGKVGMTGTSYNGTLPLAAATTGVEGLEAIIPIAPNTSYYHYYRSNGLVRSPGGYLGEDIDVLYDFVHSGDKDKRAFNNQTVRDTKMKKGMDRETGDYNDFWAERDYLNQMPKMKAALLMSHGFNDWNVMPEHSYRIYKAAKEYGLPTQIYYHQKGHGGPPPLTLMNRWFSKYLHGVDNGVEKEENKAYIVRENDDSQEPTAYKDYPNPDASFVTLNLTAGGKSSGGLTLDKASKADETFFDDASISGSDLAKAANSENRLLYVTSKLTEDLHISGVPKVTITLASSKAAANLSVWLVSLPWQEGKAVKITDNIITRGWADPKNYKSLTEEENLVPNQSYSLTFDLQPDDQIIKAGQQIGFMIFSSDKEFTLHPKPGTEIVIELDKTTLSLPVVGGKKGFEQAFD
ncbi:Xaa-Pro dipeptidyl-peptidase [Winogradskyella bathintestinalis]|uniref:Xaa-Pro dipeptidyl-peptidase n=1 Tax=Winogradskyella bathintestinalis TaxID=3035208 RepID=A0ABT7ZYB8_9FLAO|nr:Xaa-Pro dipeptidyl-peptidase [Winogradskyella bathintestinalis]MDN3493992.1 Xaa-Pro dipeptidyl-peptidase [Winogradskyella bathintestinalis]